MQEHLEKNAFKKEFSRDLISIKNLTEFLPLKVDWLKILRSLVNFEVDESFQIYLVRPEYAILTFQRFESMDERLFANLFQTQFLFHVSKIITPYFHSTFDAISFGVAKAEQRFEQCLYLLQFTVPVAFKSLFEKRFSNKRSIEDAYVVVNRTMTIIIKDVENDETLPLKNKQYILNKLKSLKIVLGYPEELLVAKNVEDYYKDLNITGTESLLRLIVETYIFTTRHNFRKYIKTNNSLLVRNETTRWIDYLYEYDNILPVYELDTKNAICENTSAEIGS